MKFKLLLVTVAAAILAPYGPAAGAGNPNATLYGNFRYSLNYINEDGIGSDIDGLQGRDNISLFGVKGEYGNDRVKAFFHLQTQTFADGNTTTRAFKQRFFFGGLKGQFGKVSFGRMTNAYKLPGFAMDPFYNLSHIGAGGAYGAGGATYGLSGATNGFTNNALQYETPRLDGFGLVGGFYVDDSNENDHSYVAGGSYSSGKLLLGSVLARNGETAATVPGVDLDGFAIRSYATYNLETFRIGVSYEKVDTGGGDVNFLYATSTVSMREIDTDLSLSVGIVDGGATEGFGVTAGAFHTVVDNAQLFSIVSYTRLENGDNKPFVLSVGANFNFSLFVD